MSSDHNEQYVFAPAVPSVAVSGSAKRFPVRRVYCVGRNYADHAREMGHDPDREPPFFFTKHPDSLIASGSVFPYPSESNDVHHEIELVVAIGRGGRNIAAEDALEHVFGYGVGLDMTRRDLQGAAKKAGRPWEIGKAFDAAAPCSEIVPASGSGHPAAGEIWLDVNGERRQQGDLSSQIWSGPEVIAHLSRYFALEAGDLIYTGTPAGVGPVKVGDRLEGGIAGVGSIAITVGAQP